MFSPVSFDLTKLDDLPILGKRRNLRNRRCRTATIKVIKVQKSLNSSFQMDSLNNSIERKVEKVWHNPFDNAKDYEHHSKDKDDRKKRRRCCCGYSCLQLLLMCGCLSLLLGAIIGLSIALASVLNVKTSTSTTTTTSTTTSTTTVTTSTTSSTTSTSTTSTSTTTISTSTTSTTTETSSTTTNTTVLQLLTGDDEIVTALWNTTAGGDSTVSSPGTCIGCHWPDEYPERAFDRRMNRYTNYGHCGRGNAGLSCGTDTGLHVTLQRGSSLLVYVVILTGGTYPERDVLTITIEGSNARHSALFLGSNWNLIYSGPSGLLVDPGRTQLGEQINMTGNTVWYRSYRILGTSKRGGLDCIQFGEIELYGY